MGIPLQLYDAVNILFSGQKRKVDIGYLNNRFFINGLGIGLDGAVSHRFKNLKRLRGELGYLFCALQEAVSFKGFQVKIDTGDWSYDGRALLAGASNGPFQGGNFRLTPDAKVDDGKLDLYVFDDMPVIKRILQMPKVRQGKHTELPDIHIRQSSCMKITTFETLPAHMDGEPFELSQGTHEVKIKPLGLEVLTQEYN